MLGTGDVYKRQPGDIAHLREDCVVPVFSKDNEVTSSHQSCIETVLGAAHRMFPQEVIDAPDIVVSHIIKGDVYKRQVQVVCGITERRRIPLLFHDGRGIFFDR